MLFNGTERMYLKVISKLLDISIYIYVCVYICFVKDCKWKARGKLEKRKRNVKKLSLIILKPNKILSLFLSFTEYLVLK